MEIQILPPEMASRIAAGEVVERPASVVKELVENSLDAGSSEISVSIEKSGASLIRVVDNGAGMSAEDLALSVERHATSKIREEDDLSRIGTLGFRGEALPSIASVCRLEITSRLRSAPAANRLRVEGGRKQELVAAGAAAGTCVEIRDIFYNTPARRKFLKSPATELSHVCETVNRIALARPDVHFQLFHDSRRLADYVAVRDAKERLRQVFGPALAQDLAPFGYERGELRVSGHLSTAPMSFPNGRYVMTYVNGRYVRDRIVTHAVISGYDSLLMKGQYPAVFLFLRAPLTDVDVNVHPAKIEVRFRRQAEIYETVMEAVRLALRREAARPASRAVSGAPAGREFVMEPPFPYAPRPVNDDPAPVQTAPCSAAAQATGDGFYSSLTILGQLLGCYIVCASRRGMVLIDQHAAHERVVYERLRGEMERGEVSRQNLLIPQTVELSKGEKPVLETHLSALAGLGFVLEPFGPDAYTITAVPALLPEGDYRPVLRQMIAEVAEVERSGRVRRHLEERLATIACHSVIRANRMLEAVEIRALLADLDRTEFASQCPHGRPVLIEFTGEQLDKMFKRAL